ncbi:MAG TPA: hypothetical protein VF974_08160 [Patescibacteria group bacterium]
MEKVNDGGPAFPIDSLQGMSLRDWFAGNERSYPSVTWCLKQPDFDSGKPSELGKELMARWRYEIADTMLVERNLT